MVVYTGMSAGCTCMTYPSFLLYTYIMIYIYMPCWVSNRVHRAGGISGIYSHGSILLSQGWYICWVSSMSKLPSPSWWKTLRKEQSGLSESSCRGSKRGAMSNGSALPHCLCSRALPLDIAPRFARFALRSTTWRLRQPTLLLSQCFSPRWAFC